MFVRNTEVSGVYVVNSAGVGHFRQQVVEHHQAERLHDKSALAMTWQLKERHNSQTTALLAKYVVLMYKLLNGNNLWYSLYFIGYKCNKIICPHLPFFKNNFAVHLPILNTLVIGSYF